MAGYAPPRGADGKIIVGPLAMDDLLDDEEAPIAPPPSPQAPPAPPRRPGDTPTAFGQLRPGQAAPVARGGSWASYAAAAIVVALLALALLAMRGQAPAAPAAAVAPSAVATSASGGPTLPAAMVAYTSPGGSVIGALEPGRPYAVVGRSGADWLQIDIGEPKPVWVPAFAGAPAAAVPDLATPTPEPTATPVPYVAPAPAYVPLPDPAYVAPTAVPQATCKAVILDGQEIGQACGYDAAAIHATADALMSTPRGGVPVTIVTRTPLDMRGVPTARP